MNKTDRMGMKIFHKENLGKFPIIAVAFTALLLVGILAIKRKAMDYMLSPDEMVSHVLLGEGELTTEEARRIIESEEPGYQFVDIRNPFEYQQGRIGDALNIPANRILESEYINMFKTFRRDSIIVILYGAESVDVNVPWMILKQLGFSNVLILPWGYDYFVSESSVREENSETQHSSPEDLRYDIPSIITAGRAGLPDDSEMQEIEQLVPVRKKKRSVTEGGC